MNVRTDLDKTGRSTNSKGELRPGLAFVLAGGGSLGAIQIGMLEALLEAGAHPHLVVGASVGTVNGSLLAAQPDAEGVARLRTIWTRVRRRDVFPWSPWGSVLSFLSWRNHLIDPGGLRRILERSLPYRRLEETRVPFHVVTTDVLSGLEVVLSRGPVVEAVLASSAIPGVFPPVARDGRCLVDGGVASNTPISAAFALGARRMIVLPTGFACRLERPPRSALGMALQGLNLLIARQLLVDLHRFAPRAELHVVPPPCPIDRSPVDFDDAAELMDLAATTTRAWIADGGLSSTALPGSLEAHRH